MIAIGGTAGAVVAGLVAASLVGGVPALPFVGDRGGQAVASALQLDPGLHFERGSALSDRTAAPSLMVSASWRQRSGKVCAVSAAAREKGVDDPEAATFRGDGTQLRFPATAGRTYEATVKGRSCTAPSKDVASTANFVWRLHQERAATYSSGWILGHCTCWSGKSVMASSGAGQTATFVGLFTSFGLVADHGRNRGSADIFLDGVKVGSIDGHRKAEARLQVDFAVRAKANATHTVLVKVTSGRVDIDAFLTSGDPRASGVGTREKGSAGPSP